MEFVTDKQTLDDLNLLGRYKNNSIFSLFNHTVTTGGSRLLEKMLQQPFTNIEDINRRRAILSFFQELNVALPFEAAGFEVVENYIRNPESKNRLLAGFNLTRSKLMHQMANEKEYSILREGLETTLQIFSKLKELIQTIAGQSEYTPYHPTAQKLLQLLSDVRFEAAWQAVGESPLPFKKVLQLDYTFRGLMYEPLEDLLKELYTLDVYITVSGVAKAHNFVYAEAIAKAERYVNIQGLYHPSIPNPIANDVHIGTPQHVFFLTGANMAGKSTLMKSFGVAVYLAHMGFPVAAKAMSFSLHDGIYTSINVPDDITQGYSHFYAEVLRVKHVAEEVATDKQLVVIFDELFKGTNVKDAYDGTVAIVDAFSKRHGTFIISTHIMEAGETLQKNNPHLFFKFLPTVMEGKVPTYPRILEAGITDDRHGMIIIKNEGILEIINGGKILKPEGHLNTSSVQ